MKSPHLLLAASLLVPSAFAATHAVLPGGSIQAKVDAAAPGDIVAIFGGTYPGDVTVNKAVRLVEVDGQDVTITGNVTWSSVTNAPPFEGFTVGSSGKGITITNTTGLVLKNIDARPGSGVVVNGTSKVGITGGYYSQISQDGGELTTTLTQVTGDFMTTINCTKTVSLRSNVTGNFAWNSRNSWCGYSKGYHFKFYGSGGTVNVVGCEFDGRSYYLYTWPGGGNPYVEHYGIDIRGSNNVINILNNSIRRMVYGYEKPTGWSGPCVYAVARGVYVAGDQQSTIANNYIEIPFLYFYQGSHGDAAGVRIESSNSKIFNNIIEGPLEGVRAPFGADVRNNFFYGLQGPASAGGHVATNSLSGDPLYVANDKPRLQVASPCINAGVNDPIYNDLDGSRNDIGPSGGCLFDPNGWTTANPVVISFDLAPQQLLKGVDTSVNLSSGQAVAQP